MLLTWPDAITVVLILVFTVASGLLYKGKTGDSGRDKEDLIEKNGGEKNEGEKNENNKIEEYILAGNQIGYVATGFSLSASFLSAFGMIGLPTQAMISGTVIFFSQVGVSFLVVGLIHFYVLPLLKKHNLPSVFSIIRYKYRTR